MMQVNALKSVYCQNLRLGYPKDIAFADAIATTSDKALKKADPKLVELYFKNYGKDKAKQRIKNQPAYAGSRSWG